MTGLKDLLQAGGLGRLPNTECVFCHRTLESIRVKFRLKHNQPALKGKDEKYTERRLKTSPVFLSKALTHAQPFQRHDSLLCAAPVEGKANREGSVHLYEFTNAVLTWCQPSSSLCTSAGFPRAAAGTGSSALLKSNFDLPRPPPFCVAGLCDGMGGGRLRSGIIGSVASSSAEQLMRISRLNESLAQIDNANLYTCSRQRNQFESSRL